MRKRTHAHWVILAICLTWFGSGTRCGAQSSLEYVSNTNSAIPVPWTYTFSIPKFNGGPYTRLDNIAWYIQPTITARATVRNTGSSNIFSSISGSSRLTVQGITSFDQLCFAFTSSSSSTLIRPGSSAQVSSTTTNSPNQGSIDRSDFARFQGAGSITFQATGQSGTPTVSGGGQVSSPVLLLFGGIRITYYYSEVGQSQADPITPATASSAPTFVDMPSGRWVHPNLPGAGLVYTSATPGGTFNSLILPTGVYGRFSVYANTNQFVGVYDAGATVNFQPGTVSKIHLYAQTAGASLTNMPVRLNFSGPTMSVQISRVSTATGSSLLYKDSGFQSTGGAAAALDSGKILTPGSVETSSTFANVSNYARGLNSLVLDVANLASTNLTAADYTLRVSPPLASGLVDPSNWATAPAPSGLTITPGTATAPARLQFDFADNAIQNQWLQVTLNATSRTGLAHPAVVYVGHALAEVNGAAPYRVTAADLSLVQVAISNDLVGLEDTRDINKDRRITVADLSLLQSRISPNVQLNNITIPALGTSASAPGALPNETASR